MVTESGRRAKFYRWRINFPKTPQVRTWKHALREVVVNGHGCRRRINVIFAISRNTWTKAVAYLGAYRFVRLARDRDRTLPRLRITGIHTELTGISEQVDFAADEVDGSSLWTRLRLQTMLRP